MEIFDGLDSFLKTFWFVAIPTSVIFLIQSIMTFVGSDATDGLQTDFDGDITNNDQPFQLFSFRNLINFLLGLSWTGISFYSLIENKTILITLSLLIGLVFVYVFFIIIKQVQKLAEDNSFKISDTLNKTADVYLTIPENKNGKGKVMISINGSFHELDAMSENNSIPTGSVVRVTKIENNNLLIVEKI
jgi:membrane protein implicated in regulation of membrane protease activity